MQGSTNLRAHLDGLDKQCWACTCCIALLQSDRRCQLTRRPRTENFSCLSVVPIFEPMRLCDDSIADTLPAVGAKFGRAPFADPVAVGLAPVLLCHACDSDCGVGETGPRDPNLRRRVPCRLGVRICTINSSACCNMTTSEHSTGAVSGSSVRTRILKAYGSFSWKASHTHQARALGGRRNARPRNSSSFPGRFCVNRTPGGA